MKSYIDELNKKSLMGVSLDNFKKLKDNIDDSTPIFVNNIFGELNNLIFNVIEEGIQFYNNLLEKQKRYEEETEEKRNYEKLWLDSQREEFERLQRNIEGVLFILS